MADLSQYREKFFQLVAEARIKVKDPLYLNDKWLRPSEELFSWYSRAVSRAKIRPGVRVCDLGAGPGYFLWFLREAYGCSINGIESKRRKDYETLWQCLNLDTVISIQKIVRFCPIRYDFERYDYITATGICFHRISRDELWGPEEYSFFLKDACQHLNSNGEIYLRFNKLPAHNLLNFFKSLNSWEGDNCFRVKREIFLGLNGAQ